MIRGILAILKGKATPEATAAGFAMGMILGLMPKGNMMAGIFFLLFFLTTANKPVAMMSSLLFTPVGLILDGLAHPIGLALLTAGPLQGLWTALYNIPVVPWTAFNNTAVLGHLLIGLGLFYPVYHVVKKAIAWYQARLKNIVAKFKIVQVISGMRIWHWWESIKQQ